jgi:hypothetical protein
MVIIRFSPIMRKIKIETMKKILIFLIFGGILAGCYPEFRNDFTYTTVAFSPVTGGLSTAGQLGRTVVKNEGLRLNIGVYLAGRLENKKDEWVKFVIDPTLLASTTYTLLPADYYTLSSPDKFVIHTGEFVGKLLITLDSVKFVNDPLALGYNYAIPIKLTETSADSILSTQYKQILVLKYINHYEGNYDQTATYETFDGGTVIHSGTIKNVIYQKTISLDSTLLDGMLYISAANAVKYCVRPDNTVYMKKMPVPVTVPVNLSTAANALSTDFIQSGRSLEAMRDLYDPINSQDKTTAHEAYGNWPSPNIERWVEYAWNNPVLLNKSEIYWWNDGPTGGMQPPTSNRLMYWNLTTLAWEEVPNHVGYGNLLNQYNVTTFDQIQTTKVRVYMINTTQSVGILEWKIWGNPAAVYPEQSKISDVAVEGTNLFDQATSTFNLNYRINYEGQTYYTIVNTKLVWRNRIRDGVNEWRR